MQDMLRAFIFEGVLYVSLMVMERIFQLEENGKEIDECCKRFNWSEEKGEGGFNSLRETMAVINLPLQNINVTHLVRSCVDTDE